ncbi:AAA-16 domain-containing protein [Favolaschia claudopus]|uniref:AAA-16 domain-containing protein n=1 Tax=Favolaschia claudopus TaxID=2862362 RepID=A0AAW0CUZ4_9AGAR
MTGVIAETLYNYRPDAFRPSYTVANLVSSRHGFDGSGHAGNSTARRQIEDEDVERERSYWEPVSACAKNIYIGSFFATQGLAVRPIHSRREIGLDILRRTFSIDPASVLTNLRCLPGTRRKVLDVLLAWASEAVDTTYSVVCLTGPSGVGKSAILGSFTQQLHGAGELLAGFAFRPQWSPKENANALFCSLAYRLALHTPQLRESISRAVKMSPGIVGRSMEEQLQDLIIRPYLDLMRPRPLTLVIDGFDGFEDDVQRNILNLLENAARTQSLNLRVLLTSRSEEIFWDSSVPLVKVERSLHDVQFYLWSELCGPQSTTTEFVVSPPIMNTLVEASSGCFLYACTLVKFLTDRDFAPAKRFAAMTSLPVDHLNSPLDKLYTQILSAVPSILRSSLLSLLHVLCTEQFARLPIYYLAQLLQVKRVHIRCIARHLRSVLSVSSKNEIITPDRSSFLEFLADPSRSGPLCVASPDHSMNLARCILKSLAYTHQSPHANRVGHVAWKHLSVMVDYVTSVHPSIDLLPFVKKINPDFFFGSLRTFDKLGAKILAWLNKMELRPIEEIQRWEDYSYMAFVHSTVNDFDFDAEPDMPMDDSKDKWSLLQNPELIRLLRFSMALPALTPLFQFRLLLGYSWGELRSVICALRAIYGRDEMALTRLWSWLQDPNFAREIYPWPSVFRALALQSVRLVKGVHGGALPSQSLGYWLEWGRYIRSSPPCPELLCEISSFMPRDGSEYGISTDNEIYDVLRWFESYPDVPRSERSRWARYLPRGTRSEKHDAFETRWRSWVGLEWYEV